MIDMDWGVVGCGVVWYGVVWCGKILESQKLMNQQNLQSEFKYCRLNVGCTQFFSIVPIQYFSSVFFTAYDSDSALVQVA